IGSLMKLKSYKDSAIALFINKNDNQNIDLVYKKIEYYYKMIFLEEPPIEFSRELSESIASDSFHINVGLKQRLLNIANLFSSFSSFNI
ncbi:hypothetical protein, partial [Veillonella tobetsuensis]|uniref:hypothetical protein n=1 Tax=Veillonella tobetsuensis TaxID=1110546 RepID=UPI001BB1178D